MIVALPTYKPVPRDGWDRPLVVPQAGGTPVGHTRTTTFIDCIEDKSGLTDWKMRSVLAGAVADPSIIEKAAKLDPEDPAYKKAMAKLVEAAEEAAGSYVKREKGTAHHELTELVDAGLALPENTPIADLLDMAAYKLATIDFDIEHTEQLVVVNELTTAGTPDRVSRYTGPGPREGITFENELLITDLKTGSMDFGQLKMPAQLGVYSRGLVYDHTKFPVEPVEGETEWNKQGYGKKALAKWKKISWEPEVAASAYTSLGPINQEWGVVFHMVPGSATCELHWIDLVKGWELAEFASVVRDKRKTRGTILPFRKLEATATAA